MHYEQLPATYKDDTIAQALYAREVEHFHYAFDAANFERLLADEPPGDYRNDLVQRLSDTRTQMRRVEAIAAALRAQITDPAAHAAAVERAIAYRKTTP